MKRIKDNDENEGVCRDFCGSCPSYPGSNEWLFCARGKSKEDITMNGCLCPSCQVYLDNDLKGAYFCRKGVPK